MSVMNVPNIYEQKRSQKERSIFAYERIIERTVNGIKVTSHIPEDVSESFKRNRINQIYDILWLPIRETRNRTQIQTSPRSNAKVSATPEIKTQT